MQPILRSINDVKTWRIFAGICIRRPAVITPELTPVERRTADLFESVELEKSHLSAHEYRDKLDQTQLNKALGDARGLNEATNLLTAHEQELEWQSELKKFSPLSRTTEADVAANRRTAWRELDHPLVMITQQSMENENPLWSLPVMPLEKGKTLSQMAQKMGKENLPSNSRCRIFGHAPSAVHVYKFKDTSTGEKIGVQMYFFNAYVDRLWHGDAMPTFPGIKDFAWVKRDDLKEFVKDRALLRVLNSFIFEY